MNTYLYHNYELSFVHVATGVVKKPKKKEKHKALETPLPPLLAKNKDNLLVRERERERGRERSFSAVLRVRES